MNWLDVVILAILILAAYKGMGVGLIGTAVIAAAGFIGWMLAGQLADDLGGYFEKLSNDTLVTTISYVAIIATSVAVGTIVSKFIKPLLTVATLGLSGIVDKLGGVALGLAFGASVAVSTSTMLCRMASSDPIKMLMSSMRAALTMRALHTTPGVPTICS